MVLDPILVSGPPRSGTSLLTGFVHYCGAWVGDTVGPAVGNPRGFFENRYVRESITKPMLEERGIDRLAQGSLRGGRYLDPAGRREEIERAIRRQGYTHGPWVLKSSKALLMLDEWIEMFPDAIWLVTNRPAEAVADSCARAPFMVDHGGDGWLSYVAVFEARVAELMERAHVYRIDTPALAQRDLLGSGVLPALMAAGLRPTIAATTWCEPELFTRAAG